MSKAPPQTAALLQFYHRYLDDENAADFTSAVSRRYLLSTLERLAAWPDFVTRRAAVLALTCLGDIRSNDALGRALRDEDRGVRMLAESGIEELWMRDGSPPQRQLLRRIRRLNTAGRCEPAGQLASRLIEQAPQTAEAWNLRAVALYQQGEFVGAARDCRQASRLNAYHFRSMIGMAHCQLEFSDPIGALHSLRRALEVNPGLEAVRIQIRHLTQALEEL